MLSKPPPDPKPERPRVCSPLGVKMPPDGRATYTMQREKEKRISENLAYTFNFKNNKKKL